MPSTGKIAVFACVLMSLVTSALLSQTPQNTSTPKRKSPLERLATTDKEEMDQALKEWEPALKDATQEKVSMLNLWTYLASMNELYKNEKFQPEESRKFVNRIKNIPSNMILDWQSAIKTASGAKIDKLNTALLIVRLERLFEGSVLKKDEQERLLSRLRSLPQEATSAWAKARADFIKVSDEYFTPFHLIQVNQLFANDAFQKSNQDKLLKRVGSLPKDAVSKWADMCGIDDTTAAFSLIRLDSLFDNDVFQDIAFQEALAADPANVQSLLAKGADVNTRTNKQAVTELTTNANINKTRLAIVVVVALILVAIGGLIIRSKKGNKLGSSKSA